MAGPAASKPDKTALGFGLIMAAAGIYFMLVGIGAVPGPGKTSAPGAVIVCVGLAFLAASGSLLVRGLLGLDDKQADLPADAPQSFKALYALCAMLVMVALASIGTWIAFNAGAGEVKISGPISGPAGETVGRIVFGIGAVIAWLMVLAIARSTAKTLFARKDDANASSAL